MNNTRRYSRTLSEAFGPHTSTRIHSEEDKTPLHQWVIYGVACVALVAIIYWS